MTIDELIDACPVDGWEVKSTGTIRREVNGTYECPIVAVYNTRHPVPLPSVDADVAGKRLNLVGVKRVMRAADCFFNDCTEDTKPIRRRLLARLLPGVSEE